MKNAAPASVCQKLVFSSLTFDSVNLLQINAGKWSRKKSANFISFRLYFLKLHFLSVICVTSPFRRDIYLCVLGESRKIGLVFVDATFSYVEP